MTDPGRPLRVLLVAGQRLTREGLRLLVEAEGFAVVGDTGRGVQAVELCARAGPDVALVEPALPDLAGAALLRAIRTREPRVRVVALLADAGEPLVRELLGAGASGYLLTSTGRQGLAAAVRAAAGRPAEPPGGHGAAGRPAEPPAGHRAVNEPSGARRAVKPPQDGGTMLTPREREVLRLVAHGLTNKVIAKELAISAGTVRVYLSDILVKLGAANRTEAAMLAVRRGLVEPA